MTSSHRHAHQQPATENNHVPINDFQQSTIGVGFNSNNMP